jgi:hypothetical protein
VPSDEIVTDEVGAEAVHTAMIATSRLSIADPSTFISPCVCLQ